MSSEQNSRTINSATDENARVPLPAEVREENTAFTTVYEHGKMVYDGAAARSGDPRAAAMREAAGEGAVPSSLNEMLKWGISNSDPEALKKMAETGRQPTQVDREVMDMLLGEPIVAKMRECLGKLPQLPTDSTVDVPLEPPEGVEAALAAMEELEYYVEDIDNAVDMAKIGGVGLLAHTLSNSRGDPELREAACSVLATAVQNNPKVQSACIVQDVLGMLLSVLREFVDEDELLPLRRKALLAVSALVRSSADALEQLMATKDGVCTLVDLGGHADAKLRRRALFLLLSLSRDADSFLKLLASVDNTCKVLLEAACDADEDTREQALQLLMLLSNSADAVASRTQLVAADAPARLAAVAAAKPMVGDGDGNPEHAKQIRVLLAWLSGAD